MDFVFPKWLSSSHLQNAVRSYYFVCKARCSPEEPCDVMVLIITKAIILFSFVARIRFNCRNEVYTALNPSLRGKTKTVVGLVVSIFTFNGFSNN